MYRPPDTTIKPASVNPLRSTSQGTAFTFLLRDSLAEMVYNSKKLRFLRESF